MYYFIRLGYSVCSDLNFASDRESYDAMTNSRIVINCIDRSFQNTQKCIGNLETLLSEFPEKACYNLILEDRIMGWLNAKLKSLIPFSSQNTIDIGHINNDRWDSDEGPNAAMFFDLIKNLEPLKELVVNAGCVTPLADQAHRLKRKLSYLL
jgi:hypothetical protein